MKIKVFPTPAAVADAFADDFANWLEALPPNQAKISVALSGGSTPKILFEHWANIGSRIDWSRIHFFWGDERCVAPDDSESNYGVAREIWLDKILIPPENIHRVRGENNPIEERSRYEKEIREHVAIGSRQIPQFDLILLGMGDDGHTASIFPHQMQLLESDKVCEVATHPQSGQQRITLTGPVLNAGRWVAFLITGKSKAGVLKKILQHSDEALQFPAAHIAAENLDFYLDEAAAGKS